MDTINDLVESPKQFVKDSIALINRCSKPTQTGEHDEGGVLGHGSSFPEFFQMAFAIGMGFVIMGFIGFFVKLIHIPINNIIV
ncbi:hypothetical protein HDU83_003988 [Entophlyctis luteolus]|nr:hypothetical protein HDU83_003988 [Entophlyctis luteolus]